MNRSAQIRRSCSALALFSVLSASYSYSEPYVYGTTPNVATDYTWRMSDYLPDQPVVDINAVIYRYSVRKNVQDPFTVSIYNKDTQTDGYIFRETDDWSGLPSSTINKYIPIDNIPAYRFGDGGIETTGTGTVEGQSVLYNYRIDMAELRPTDQELIIPAQEIKLYNVLEDDAVSSEQVDAEYSDDEQKDEEREEKAKKAADKAVAIGNTQAQAVMLNSLMFATNINSYYAVSIDGGVYKEEITLQDTKLPENRRGLRNGLAQQILHSKMVDSQY